jgi:hypothetical protein
MSRPTPSGTQCKCGGVKSPDQYFCLTCWDALPVYLRLGIRNASSWQSLRTLVREAVRILCLPQTRNQQRKKLYA